MRISDWSSDVCASDLDAALGAEFAARLGFDIDADASFDYPVGSMFWIRVDALRPLLDLDLSSHDFPVESGQTDGTLQHALERLVAPATLHHGYRLGILPTDGALAMADEGERNWRQALSGTLEKPTTQPATPEGRGAGKEG